METSQHNTGMKSRLSAVIVKFRDPVYKNKFICTLFLFWAFIYLGISAGLAGPSLLDLMLITNTELDKAATLFTAGSVGSMIGALVCGVLYDRCNKLMLLAGVIVGNSIFTAVKPLCTSFPVMTAVTFVRTFFSAGIDTGGNADLMRLWEKDGRSFMQTLHFSYSFGGIFAPVVIEPFLAPKQDLNSTNNSDLGNTTAMLPALGTANLNSSWNHSSTTNLNPPESRILFAYLIVACVGLTAALPFFVEFFLRKVDTERKPETEYRRKTTSVPLPVYITTVIMIGTFFFNYCAVEMNFISFLTVFTVDGLSWTKPDGALVVSVFWASFAAFRFSGIFFIHFLNPKKMLLLYICLLVGSLCAFVLCSIFKVNVGIWVCTVGVGLATSVIFPSAFTWVEEHLINVTGKITSVIMVSVSISAMFIPIVLGYLMKKISYMWFCYWLLGQSVLLLLLYIFMNIYSRNVLAKYRRPQSGNTDYETEADNSKAKFLETEISASS